MPRPLPFAILIAAGLATSTAACSQDSDRAAPADAQAAAAGSTGNWAQLKDFSAIEAIGPDDIVVTIGTGFSVKAEGSAEGIADLDMRVEGDRLVIARKSKGRGGWTGMGRNNQVTVRVTMPAIRSAELTGAGDFDLDRAEGDSFDLDLTGAGDARIGAVALKRLTTDITGAGSLRIAGTTDAATLSVTGAGDIDGEGLLAGTATVSLLGAGDIAFASDGKVAIDILGPGDVTVKGNAQCTIKSRGPGEARCAP